MGPIRHLDIHLTHRCNLRCAYCYAGTDHRDRPEDMTEEIADRAVDFLLENCGDAPSIHISLWGGEPLLRLDLIERITGRARSRAKSSTRVHISAPTNGTLLTQPTRRLLQELGVELSLSLDGGPKGPSSRLTAGGQNAWKLIGPLLQEMVEDAQYVLPPVRMTVMPQRVDRLHADVLYLLQRSFRQLSFLPASGAHWTEAELETFDRQLDLIADDFVTWIQDGRPYPPYFAHLLRRLTVLWVTEVSGETPLRSGNCGAGTHLLGVDTRGDLYPCHRFVAKARPPENMRLGNVLQGISNHQLRQRFAEIGADREGVRCATCVERPLCGALCPALNFQHSGRIDLIPDEACFINQKLRRTAERIHTALRSNANYRDYIEPYLKADPDERLLPFLSVLQKDSDSLVQQVSDLLGGLEDGEES